MPKIFQGKISQGKILWKFIWCQVVAIDSDLYVILVQAQVSYLTVFSQLKYLFDLRTNPRLHSPYQHIHHWVDKGIYEFLIIRVLENRCPIEHIPLFSSIVTFYDLHGEFISLVVQKQIIQYYREFIHAFNGQPNELFMHFVCNELIIIKLGVKRDKNEKVISSTCSSILYPRMEDTMVIICLAVCENMGATYGGVKFSV